MKKVVNSINGKFALSKAAIDFMIKRGNKIAKKELELVTDNFNKARKFSKALNNPICNYFVDKRNYLKCYPYGSIFKLTKYRQDPDLIAAVEELGDKAWYDEFHKLSILIPYEQSSGMYFKIKYNPNLNSEDVIMCHRRGSHKIKIELSHRTKLM